MKNPQSLLAAALAVRRGDFHRIGCRPQKKANLANEIGKEDTSRTTQKI